MINDRRSRRNRRAHERFKVDIDIEWEGSGGVKPGTITDISAVGCFVTCSGEVEDNEIVKIFFPLTSGRKIQLLGEVKNHFFEIGLAMQFKDLTEAQQDFLEKFVDTLRED